MPSNNYSVLIPEIRDDPRGYGYAGQTDQLVADTINAVGAPTNISVRRKSVEIAELIEGFDKTEWQARDAPDRHIIQECLRSLVVGTLNLRLRSHRAVLDRVKAVFTAGVAPTTSAALAALDMETISRAAELGIAGVTASHVSSARTRI